MNMVILDGEALNPGDLSWAPLEELGSLTDIGELIRLCGFSSRSIFYSAFRREVGMTPTRYMAKVVVED